MATDFWRSSHCKRWIVSRATIRQARQEDLRFVDDPDHILLLNIFFANLLSKLGNKLSLRQRVIATATIFFRRFYLKNSYCDTDPYMVLAACCYVASKAEEQPIQIKAVATEVRNILSEYNIKQFPTDITKLAEMEFYLVDDLECDLVVFHPYRTLMSLVTDSCRSLTDSEREAGEVGAGVTDSKYWGTGEEKLAMQTGGIQMAWFLINDTYRSDICLLYPPHMIAIAALYLSIILQPQTRKAHMDWAQVKNAALATQTTPTRRSQRNVGNSNQTEQSTPKQKITLTPAQDFVGFFASLNVNMPMIAAISQEMLSFYALCDRLKEDSPTPTNQSNSSAAATYTRQTHSGTQGSSHSGSRNGSMTPGDGANDEVTRGAGGFKVASYFLVRLHSHMRAQREADLSQSIISRSSAVNKVLERAQAAG